MFCIENVFRNVKEISLNSYYFIIEFIENRQSSGEIIRYRISPHVKYMINERIKQEEEKRAKPEKNKEKQNAKSKQKDEAAKSEKREKSPQKKKEAVSVATTVIAEDTTSINTFTYDTISINSEEKVRQEKLEEQKRIEFLNNLSKLRKENLNMICYGLPEIYMIN